MAQYWSAEGKNSQVGWLDRSPGDVVRTVLITAGTESSEPARFVLYAGEPQHEPLIHYGPFVGGSTADIENLCRRYRAGRFESISAIAKRGAKPAQLLT